MGSAESKVDNEVMNETINKTMNQTSMKMVNKTTMSQEELNKINQSIKLISPKETLLEMKKEAAELAKILCVGNDQIGKCVKDIMDSMVPPACAGGLKISQKADITSQTSAKMKSVDSSALESAMKESLKASYDAQQKGEAVAEPGIVGDGKSEVKNKVSNKTVNETINQISMEMRNELEMFQKKNNDMSQAIEVEMFPGMSAGGCDFSQDAAIKSISNIGAAKAMQIIAKVKADKSTDTKATTKQTAKAVAKGPQLPDILPILIAVAVIGGAAYFIMNAPKPASKPAAASAKAAVAQAAPAAPTGLVMPPTPYPVGQVVTLPNGQKALIQSFGRRKIKA
tara:strand:- start:757 stop:1776 length:1020 start_codon:yes stop_codon:yes gene_type:complete